MKFRDQELCQVYKVDDALTKDAITQVPVTQSGGASKNHAGYYNNALFHNNIAAFDNAVSPDNAVSRDDTVS